MSNLDSCLRDYERTKMEYDRAAANFAAELDAVTKRLKEFYRIDALQAESDFWRQRVEDAAVITYDVTGDKTVLDRDGYKVQIAVTKTLTVTDEAATFAAIHAAGMSGALVIYALNKARFNKWALTQAEIGAPVPGVVVQESRSVRVTLPKREEATA